MQPFSTIRLVLIVTPVAYPWLLHQVFALPPDSCESTGIEIRDLARYMLMIFTENPGQNLQSQKGYDGSLPDRLPRKNAPHPGS